MLASFLLLLFCVHGGNTENCNARKTDSSSIICVCNSTYCDTLPQLDDLSSGQYQVFTSTEDGLRLEKTHGSFSKGLALNLFRVTVDRSKTHQTILGWGGAFTDAAGINIARLPEPAQEKLLQAYFSTDGAEYNLGRVPIGGTDFSVRGYTYADDSEGTLDGFSLQEEDYSYKIPYIRKADELTKGGLKLLASAWSPPVWMKTIKNLTAAKSFLEEEYYQLWADYYIKFFDAYAENDVKFWALTTQNEPRTGFLGVINSLAWTPGQLIHWLTENLGPTIRNSKYSNLDILIHDDQIDDIPFVQMYYDNPAALNYTDGVSVHWYETRVVPNSLLLAAKTDKKDVYLLQTESCTGFTSSVTPSSPVELGNWKRAKEYVKSIIKFLNYDSVGWIDWNLVLDPHGGPNWVNNQVDAPIIVNATSGEFYKQPTYYALSHFSKYVPSGSIRINAINSPFTLGIGTVAFLRPDSTIVVVLHNEGIFDRTIAVYDTEVDGYAKVKLTSGSIATLVYK